MPYFTIGKIFLFPSYDLSVEEKNIFDIYLSILEDSGVGAIIENATKKKYYAGRHPYNPYRLFATIIYGFSKVCLKDIHLDNVRIFGQGVQKFVQLNLYTAL